MARKKKALISPVVGRQAPEKEPEPVITDQYPLVTVLERIAASLELMAAKPATPKAPPPRPVTPEPETIPMSVALARDCPLPVPPDVKVATLQVAAKVGAEKVKALLHNFGVNKAGELSEADQPRYLKALAKLQ